MHAPPVTCGKPSITSTFPFIYLIIFYIQGYLSYQQDISVYSYDNDAKLINLVALAPMSLVTPVSLPKSV